MPSFQEDMANCLKYVSQSSGMSVSRVPIICATYAFAHAYVTCQCGPPYWITAHGVYPIL